MKSFIFKIYMAAIVMPVLVIADWLGKNHTGEQMDDED